MEAEKQTEHNGYIKKETMIIAISIALLLGFIGGVVFSSFKFKSGIPGSASMPPRQTNQQKESLAELDNKIQKLEKETVSDPENTEAWIRLGNAYFDSDKYKIKFGTKQFLLN